MSCSVSLSLSDERRCCWAASIAALQKNGIRRKQEKRDSGYESTVLVPVDVSVCVPPLALGAAAAPDGAGAATTGAPTSELTSSSTSVFAVLDAAVADPSF